MGFVGCSASRPWRRARGGRGLIGVEGEGVPIKSRESVRIYMHTVCVLSGLAVRGLAVRGL